MFDVSGQPNRSIIPSTVNGYVNYGLKVDMGVVNLTRPLAYLILSCRHTLVGKASECFDWKADVAWLEGKRPLS